MSKIDNKEVTRLRILDQGVSLLKERGYHGTGVQEILAAVGVPKGSFYHYFGSKEAFGAEVIRHYIEPFIERLEHFLNRGDLSGEGALNAYFAEMIEELQRTEFKGGCLLGNLIGEIADTSEVCRSALASALHRYRDKLREGITRAQAENAFRRDKSALEMADLLADSWQGALLRMKVEQSTGPLKTCCESLLRDYFRR
jgi:TetR/AcrR family transcriptional regulator, transcriptional repressor for nem operon